MAVADPQFPVTWRMAREGETLAIHYQIANRTAEDVWLLDLPHVPTTAGYQPQPDRILVGIEGKQAHFLRGHQRPPAGQGVAVEYTPVARRLAAGATLTGQARVPLPLQPWHPYYLVEPTKRRPTQGQLALGLLVGTPPDGFPAWDDRFTADTEGTAIEVPTLVHVVQRQKLVGAEPLPIP